MDLGSIMVIGVIAAAWIAAAVFGTDSRDREDWFWRTDLRTRPPRTGD